MGKELLSVEYIDLNFDILYSITWKTNFTLKFHGFSCTFIYFNVCMSTQIQTLKRFAQSLWKLKKHTTALSGKRRRWLQLALQSSASRKIMIL